MDDTIIKKTDKGSIVVVMDKKKYMTEAKKQLSDERFYEYMSLAPLRVSLH